MTNASFSREPIIATDSLTKVFKSDELFTYALRSVSLEIYAGEFVVVAGPSGCGKSTFLSIVGLLDVPSSGVYRLNGIDTTSLSMRQRSQLRNRDIGFIFQSFNLIGDLTVRENVELPLNYRRLSAHERRRRSGDALMRVGMEHRATHFPAQLSGGQQQRVAVARAIAGEPAILLADEPTGNLDSSNGEAVMQLLTELHDTGSTICMVTHDPRFTGSAERRIELSDGQLVESALAGGRSIHLSR